MNANRDPKHQIRNKSEGPNAKIRNGTKSGASVSCFGYRICFEFQISLWNSRSLATSGFWTCHVCSCGRLYGRPEFPATGGSGPGTSGRVRPNHHAPAASRRGKDLTRWWALFDDPILTSLVERAIQSNLDLMRAKARIRQARAAQRGCRVAASGSTVDASTSSGGIGPP